MVSIELCLFSNEVLCITATYGPSGAQGSVVLNSVEDTSPCFTFPNGFLVCFNGLAHFFFLIEFLNNSALCRHVRAPVQVHGQMDFRYDGNDREPVESLWVDFLNFGHPRENCKASAQNFLYWKKPEPCQIKPIPSHKPYLMREQFP